MNRLVLVVLALLISVCCYNRAIAQNSVKTGSLNDVTIQRCFDRGQIDRWIEQEQKKHLVLDARPFAINQSKGQLLYTGRAADVSVVHMNPFVYSYRISVAQQELVSTALSDFLRILLPQGQRALLGLQSGEVRAAAQDLVGDKLSQLERRLGKFDRKECKLDPVACDAMAEIYKVVDALKDVTSPPEGSALRNLGASPIPAEFLSYSTLLTNLRDEQLDTWATCDRATKLNDQLSKSKFDVHFQNISATQEEISRLTSQIDDLKELVKEYNADPALNKVVFRCNGFSCIKQIEQYATAVTVALGDHQRKLDSVRDKAQEMQKTFLFTEQLQERKGVFARSFTVESKFELSQATITVGRTKVLEQQANMVGTPQSGTPQSGTLQSGTPQSGTPQTGSPGSAGSTGWEGSAGSEGSAGASPAPTPDTGSEGIVKNEFGQPFVPTGGLQAGAPPPPSPAPASGGNPAANAAPPVGDLNEVVQIGRPKFKLSGGLVYSPLPRRTFKKVTGFALDAQGNPIGNADQTVVGFDQNSPRRLLPMLFLNSRLLDYESGSLYFSFGITGKKDNNLDLEYLIGPSVSFLNDRALFTFGAYGGMTQNLVSDVRVGQVVPDALGNAEFFRKSLTWKPGFSFSYNLSREKKGTSPVATSGAAAAANDLRNEIRIGSVPFNLAFGLAVTSLEQRTYDEIAGLARDRQGNLTNGQNLARIVGLSSSSEYRMTPLVLLHSRLTNFGAYDFYFSTGITGRKTDDDFDVEYLLGGSVNVYRRKVFLTFGTFIGKQKVLSSGFFEGMSLTRSQDVLTENRYVWKPAIAISYDISRIIPRPSF